MESRILIVDDSPTIRRVIATTLEHKGYLVHSAASGDEALRHLREQSKRPDLLLIDDVMPHMPAADLCAALQSDPELADLPVVLMSVSPAERRDALVAQTGAIDAIAKPFDAQALVSVVAHALHRIRSGRASSTRMRAAQPASGPKQKSPSVAPTRDSHDTPPHPAAASTAHPGDAAQVSAASTRITDAICNIIQDHAESRTALSPHAAIALARTIATWVTSDAAMRNECIAPASRPLLAGDMAAMPIGAIFQLLHAENQSGQLHCRSGETEIVATFRRGLVDHVSANGTGEEFSLGRYFLAEGILDEHALAACDAVVAENTADALAKDAPSNLAARTDVPLDAPQAAASRPLESPERRSAVASHAFANALLSRGVVTEEQLRIALSRQASELLYETLRWQHGRFEFRCLEPLAHNAIDERTRLRLPVATIVMEGFRRIDEWRLLERTLGRFDTILLRDDLALRAIAENELSSHERLILQAVDGQRSLREVIAASHMSSFDTCRTLAQFLEARVIRRHGPAPRLE